jgi:phage I-like protein
MANMIKRLAILSYEIAADGKAFRLLPAAGWITSMEWREAYGDEPGGLYVTPEWTDRAATMIAAREYRYISPVFSYDDQGRVLDVHHAGLVNFAGLDGLTDLAALSAHFQHDEETSMNETLKKLLAALGLAETTTEADALSAVVTLKAKAESAEGQIAALKAASPDPAKWVSVATVTDLQSQVAALSAEKVDREVGELVTAGLADGRILPAMEGWARDLGKKDTAALKSYLDAAPPVAALQGTQTGGKKPDGAGGKGALDDNQMAVCRSLGIKPEDFKATLDDQARLIAG